MRIVKVGVLAPTNKGIPLGVQGENLATEVEFDTRPWFREYPSGTVSAVAKREGDKAPYPLSLDVADGTAVWTVSDTDTTKAGEGAVELTMTSGGARVRSLTFKTLVTASLTDAPVDDDAWYGWLDKAVVKVDETVQTAQRKMAEVDAEWTGIKADVDEKVEELGKVASQAADDAHHAKVDAQATAKALESAEGSVAKAEAAATRAEGAAEQAYGAARQASVSAGNASDAASDAREASAQAAGWADMADKSATRAAESEENAALSASSAADSAERATAQKVAAENAKDAAESFKAGAEAAKGEAAASASSAAESATAAAQSANDAAASVGAINVIAPKTVATAAVAENESIAIGEGAVVEGKKGIAIGEFSKAIGTGSISVGYNTQSVGKASITNGIDTSCIGNNSFIFGYNSSICATQCVAIGSGAFINGYKVPDVNVKGFKASVLNSVAIGSFSVADENSVVSVGNDDESVTKYFRVTNDSGKLSETAPYWASQTQALPKSAQHLKRRIIHVADPIDWHNAANKNYVDANTSNALTGTAYGNPTAHVEDAWPGKPLGLTIDGAYKQDGTPSPENPVPITVIENPVLKVTGANTSEAGTSFPITLPAGHPYLAALPNGTHDEIVIDKYGNASLVERVKAITLDDINRASNYEEKANGADFQVYLGNKFKYGVGLAVSNVCVEGDVDQNDPVNGGVIKGGYIRMTKPEKVTDIASAKAYLIEIGFAAYIATVTTVTYPLGKLDIPSLPETISNVWTDAELTTNMSMTYKQDVNIVIAGLTAQIAALKGTTDIAQGDSTASPDDAIDVPDNDVKLI